MPRTQSSEKRIQNFWSSQPSSSTKVTSDTVSRTHKTLASTCTQAKDSMLAAQETKNTPSDQQNRTTKINRTRKQMGYEAAKRKIKPDSKTSKDGSKASKAGSAWTPVTHQSLYSTTSQFALRRQATTFTELEKLTSKIKRVLEDRTVSSGQPKAAVGPTRMKLQFNSNAKPNKQSFQSQQILIPGKVNC